MIFTWTARIAYACSGMQWFYNSRGIKQTIHCSKQKCPLPPSVKGVPAYNQISTRLQVIRTVRYIYFLKRNVLAKSRVFCFGRSPRTRTTPVNDRVLLQENRVLGQYHCSSKAECFQQRSTRYALWNLQNRSVKEEILWQWNFKAANKVVSFNWWKSSGTHRDTPAR